LSKKSGKPNSSRSVTGIDDRSPTLILRRGKRRGSRRERNLVIVLPLPQKATAVLVGFLLVVADIVPVQECIKFLSGQ